MTKVEIEKQKAILKRLNYSGDKSVIELIDFMSNLVVLISRDSESISVNISSANLRLQLEMINRDRIQSAGIFSKYKYGVLWEINRLNRVSKVDNLVNT